MSTTTPKLAPSQRKKVAVVRTARLADTAGGPALVIHQQEGKGAVKVDCYFLEPIVCQLGGRGLVLHKHDGTSYCVRLDGTDSTCDCPGFEHYGWRLDKSGELVACKHVMELLKFQSEGKLS